MGSKESKSTKNNVIITVQGEMTTQANLPSSSSGSRRRKSVAQNPTSAYYYSSEDDERWGVEQTPLINAFSCGWAEDGRLGYLHPDGLKQQLCPRPIETFAVTKKSLKKSGGEQYICKKASVGSRHSLFLMIECSYVPPPPPKDPEASSSDEEDKHKYIKPKRKRKVLITGLNQVGLCEEPGTNVPVEMPWDDSYDRPVDVTAGRGNSFITTKSGQLYSYGQGRFGVLGHGDCESYNFPRRIIGLDRKFVRKVSVGGFHAVAMTDEHIYYSWGRNSKGQLGIGFESPEVLFPTPVEFPQQASKASVADIACGYEHTIALVKVKTRISDEETIVYGWGDESRGQLGSGDRESRFRPQENRYLTKFCRNAQIRLKRIISGGYHCFALTEYNGQVLAWGANDYGQLGIGNQFDTMEPKLVPGLERVLDLDAGLRYSMAVVERQTIDVLAWGNNSYGELGLGDTDVRLNPTKISAIKNTNVWQVACGERHSVIVTSHKPVLAREVPALKPYFNILEAEGKNRELLKKLKWALSKEGMDPNLLDNPKAILPDQPGAQTEEVKNDRFEKGLRYCLDTHKDPFDWRRKAMETCFEVHLPGKHLKKVCLSCARLCLPNARLRPYTRHRHKSDTCDCRTSGLCVSMWTPARSAFDKICHIDDNCIGPNQIRGLLKSLRAPFPVENADVEDCLTMIADGVEDSDTPRIKPVPFEKWYRRFYDENATDDHFMEEEG